MRGLRRTRSDLVVGMTLAEVFLLLLIVGWYGSRLESEEKGAAAGASATVPKSQLDECQANLLAAEKRLQAMQVQYDQLDRILDWIAQTAGLPRPIRSVEDAKAAVGMIKDEAKRGRPACSPNNILLDVTADGGAVLATVRQSFVGAYTAGQDLRTSVEIEGFLQRVSVHYKTLQSESGRDCVFDFSLSWRTDQDYRSSRELFERYFYPARIRQLR